MELKLKAIGIDTIFFTKTNLKNRTLALKHLMFFCLFWCSAFFSAVFSRCYDVLFKVNLLSLFWRGRGGVWWQKYIICIDPVGNVSLNAGMAGHMGIVIVTSHPQNRIFSDNLTFETTIPSQTGYFQDELMSMHCVCVTNSDSRNRFTARDVSLMLLRQVQSQTKEYNKSKID